MWRSVVVAIGLALAAGCAPPELSQTGAILCGSGGDGGLCPRGYECRWDHCCPTSSNTRSCPAPETQYVRDPTGHAYPPVNGECPQGYETRFGYCCPTDSGSECPTRIIGARCSADSDCDGPNGLQALCLINQAEVVNQLHQQFPGGYCVATECDPTMPNQCGPNAFCSAADGSARGYCFRSCQLSAGTITPCAGSVGTQLCLPRSDTDLTLGACFPDCSRPENAGQCDTGYDCFDVMAGVHACAKVCNIPAGMGCIPPLVCSSTTARGYCHHPML